MMIYVWVISVFSRTSRCWSARAGGRWRGARLVEEALAILTVQCTSTLHASVCSYSTCASDIAFGPPIGMSSCWIIARASLSPLSADDRRKRRAHLFHYKSPQLYCTIDCTCRVYTINSVHKAYNTRLRVGILYENN